MLKRTGIHTSCKNAILNFIASNSSEKYVWGFEEPENSLEYNLAIEMAETVYHAWKGYDFGILNELDNKDYIRQGDHPSRSKSVYITESGQVKAQELLEKYGIEDFESK